MKQVYPNFKLIALLFAFILLSRHVAFAQPSYNYAIALSSSATGMGSYSTTTDAKGNVYVCGYFAGTVNFNPSGTANLTATGGANAFVAKYNAAGAYQWAFNVPTTGTNGGIFYKIIADLNGNIYVMGITYPGTLDFDPSAAASTVVVTTNNTTVCAKYDGNKTPSDPSFYQWVFTCGTSSASSFQNYTMAIDKDNSLYVAGEYTGPTDFDPSANTTTLPGVAGIYSMFIAKYDATKAPNDVSFLKWARSNTYTSTGSATYGRCGIKSIGLDAYGNLYATGSYFSFTNVCGNGTTCDFSGTGVPGATFGMTPVLLATCPTVNFNTTYDAFVVKYNSTGTFQYAFTIGDIYDEASQGIAVEPSGDFFLTGYYGGNSTNTANTVDFDPGAGTTMLADDGKASMFIAKYTATAGCLWAKRIASNTARYAANPRDFIRDPANNIYVTGDLFDTNIDFDPGAGTNLLSTAGNYDIFVAKYDSNGNHSWAFRVGGTLADNAKGIALDMNGNLVIAGYFRSTGLDFDPGAGTTNLSATGGVNTAYLAGYKQCDAGFDKWNGTLSNAWSTGGNWCYSAAPASSQVAVIQSGSLNNPVQVTAPQNVVDLVLQSGTSIDVKAAMNAAGNVTNVGGTLAVAAGNTLTAPLSCNNLGTLKGSGTVAANLYNYNGGVVSPGDLTGTMNVTGTYSSQKGSKLFMEVASAASYDKLVIAGAAALSDTLEVTFLGGFNPSVGQTYTLITAAAISGTFSTLKLPSTITGALAYNATSVVLTINSVLPTTLLNFTARKESSNVLLNWQTSNEINTAYYNIQFSTNGTDFTNKGRVAAKGSNSDYRFYDIVTVDNSRLPKLYYRLQMVDKNGTFTYSKTVAVDQTSRTSISVHPNPVADVLFVSGAVISAELLDISGKQVMVKHFEGTENHIPIASLSKGVYVLRLVDASGNIATERIIKQ